MDFDPRDYDSRDEAHSPDRDPESRDREFDPRDAFSVGTHRLRGRRNRDNDRKRVTTCAFSSRSADIHARAIVGSDTAIISCSPLFNSSRASLIDAQHSKFVATARIR